MEYLLMYSAGPDPQPYDPADDNIAEWAAETQSRGVSEYGERLRPGEDATTVKVRGGKVLVTEGPITKAREWVGGFDIIECRDLDEAIEIASKHPAARFSSAEVRPFMVWRDAEPGHRVVPHGFPEQLTKGKGYLMLVCVDPDTDLGRLEDPNAWVEEMDGRGVRLFGGVLRPPADATQVMLRDGYQRPTSPHAACRQERGGAHGRQTSRFRSGPRGPTLPFHDRTRRGRTLSKHRSAPPPGM